MIVYFKGEGGKGFGTVAVWDGWDGICQDSTIGFTISAALVARFLHGSGIQF